MKRPDFEMSYQVMGRKTHIQLGTPDGFDLGEKALLISVELHGEAQAGVVSGFTAPKREMQRILREMADRLD